MLYPSLPAAEAPRESYGSWATTRSAVRPAVANAVAPRGRAPSGAEWATSAAAQAQTAQSQRNRRLADAFGVDRDDLDAVRWPSELLAWVGALREQPRETKNAAPVAGLLPGGLLALRTIERRLETLCKDPRAPPVELQPTADPKLRSNLRALLEFYGLPSDEFTARLRGSDDSVKYVRARRGPLEPRVPKPLLSEVRLDSSAARCETTVPQRRPFQPARRDAERRTVTPEPVLERPPESSLWAALADEDEDEGALAAIAAVAAFEAERKAAFARTQPSEAELAEHRRRFEEQAPAPKEAWDDDEDDLCCICLCELFKKETSTLQCGHVLHAECFRAWYTNTESANERVVRGRVEVHTASCPQCRGPEKLSESRW